MTEPPLPSRAYLDSSTAAATLISGAVHHEASRQFCARLAAHGTEVYYSQFLYLEVMQTGRAMVVRRPPQLTDSVRQDFDLDRWVSSRTVRQRWLRWWESQLTTFFGQFAVTVEIPLRLRSHHLDMCHRLMAQHNLKSYDALHLAIAHDQGLNDFVTCDREFQAVTSLQIWLTRDPPLS